MPEIRTGMSCMVVRDGSEVPCRVVQKVAPVKEGDDPVFIVRVGDGNEFGAAPEDLRR